jgi:hypothetical protein
VKTSNLTTSYISLVIFKARQEVQQFPHERNNHDKRIETSSLQFHDLLPEKQPREV